ncbi:transposable element Tcb2 transposase [Trichonephila clavipes]|nr:transposable element Tcb2 transposase [Trichonephila clavipes]
MSFARRPGLGRPRQTSRQEDHHNQRLPGAIFQQDNTWPRTTRVSQDCLRTVTTLPWSARSPDLSPIEHIWDRLGRRVGHPMSLSELEAGDIINNLLDYEDGHEESDSWRADTMYARIQLSSKSEKHFLKIDTNSERSLKFQKELRACVSICRDVHKQLTNLPSSQYLSLTLWSQKINQMKLYPQVTKAILN